LSSSVFSVRQSSKRSATARPNSPALRRAANASGGNRKSSKARKARLPSTHTSPDCSRSRSVIMTATS
jgi:hypothetical protein